MTTAANPWASPKTLTTFLAKLAELLRMKNQRYGDSILYPVRLFDSSGYRLVGLCVRMDDKVSRIFSETLGEDEDPYLDLLGYIVFYVALVQWVEPPASLTGDEAIDIGINLLSKWYTEAEDRDIMPLHPKDMLRMIQQIRDEVRFDEDPPVRMIAVSLMHYLMQPTIRTGATPKLMAGVKP